MPKSKKSSKKTRSISSSRFNFTTKIFAIQNLKNFLGTIFILLGLLLFYKFPTVSKPQNHEPIHASSQFEKKSQEASVVRILLPKENIDLPVTGAKIVGGYWQTSENSASQGEGTANPGSKGNVVIFAHAREGLFYNLKDVKKGDHICIYKK